MRENEAEEIFGEIMTKKCPKLMTETMPRSKKSRENQPFIHAVPSTRNTWNRFGQLI